MIRTARSVTLLAIIVSAIAAIVAIDTPWLPLARSAFLGSVGFYIAAAIWQSATRSSRLARREQNAEAARRAHVLSDNAELGRVEAHHPDGELLGWVDLATGQREVLVDGRSDIDRALAEEHLRRNAAA